MIGREHWRGLWLALRRTFTRCEACRRRGRDGLRVSRDWYDNSRLILCDDCMVKGGMSPEKYARYEGD